MRSPAPRPNQHANPVGYQVIANAFQFVRKRCFCKLP
jgi:hypothetical protein